MLVAVVEQLSEFSKGYVGGGGAQQCGSAVGVGEGTTTTTNVGIVVVVLV